MLTFKDVEIDDRELIESYINAEDRLDCNRCFSTLYIWQRIYKTQFAVAGDMLLIKNDSGEETDFLYPMGKGSVKAAVEELTAYCSSQGHPLQFANVVEEEKDELEQLFPDLFEFAEDRDNWDYIYSAEKLAELGGKKLHAKRNHINRFMADYPDWSFEPLTQVNLDDARAMHKQWCKENGCSGEEGLAEEDCAVARTFKSFGRTDMVGGLLRAEGRVVAYSMASPLGRHGFDVHFEKAFTEVNGAYTMINREMAGYLRELRPDVVYLNREDDTGDEGLRKAKESYYPDILLEKWTAKLK